VRQLSGASVSVSNIDKYSVDCVRHDDFQVKPKKEICSREIAVSKPFSCHKS